MKRRLAPALVTLVFVGGCATPAGPAAAQGSRVTRAFHKPPHAAAACFARNAEDHSSALVSEIRTGTQSAQVIVRVKNGVLYATAEFTAARQGSTGTILLNVRTSGARNDLLDALTEGC
jgi:hypothetical protein